MLHSRRIISHICLVAVVGMVALAGVILSPAREVESDAAISFTYYPGDAGGEVFLDTATSFGWTSTGESYCNLTGLRSDPLGRIKFSGGGGFTQTLYSSGLSGGNSGNDCARNVSAKGYSVGSATIQLWLGGNDAGPDDDDDDGYRGRSGYLVGSTSAPSIDVPSFPSTFYYSATATPTVSGIGGPHGVNVRHRAQGGSAWTTSAAQEIVHGASADFAFAGLLPNTIYEVEAYLTTDPSSTQASTLTTRTLPDPTVTLAAQDITYYDATIAATITNNVHEGVTNATVLYLRYKRNGETDWSPIQQQPIVENGASFALSDLGHGSRYTMEVESPTNFLRERGVRRHFTH